MQTATLPSYVSTKLESLARDFIWGSSSVSRRVHLVKWADVCKSVSCGGLGLRRMSVQNDAFRMKMAYKLVSDPDCLWVRVLRSKYKVRELIPVSLRRSGSSRFWQGMVKVWEMVCPNLVWNIGDGRSADFWLDSWVGNLGPLIFHCNDADMVSVSSTPVATMVNPDGSWAWDKFQDFLPSSVLLAIAAVRPPSAHVTDHIGWGGDDRRIFTVKSAYSLCAGDDQGIVSPLWKAVSKYRGLPRIRLFFWSLRMIAELGRASSMLRLHQHAAPNLTADVKRWEAPAAGWIKINTDGSRNTSTESHYTVEKYWLQARKAACEAHNTNTKWRGK
ncbi:hypothetical protein V6N13_123820 [Hibiscus sabdariffa]